jgi:hypothetical protein
MQHLSNNLQPSLFDDETSRIVLAAPQMAHLMALVEALLREIAAELANGGGGDEQDHV